MNWFPDKKFCLKINQSIDWLGLVWFMVFNATFNNISVISWWSVLLVEEARENHRLVVNH